MGFGFRKSKKVGPFRFTLSKRGVSTSSGAGPVRVSRSSTGRRTTSVRLPFGLTWRKSRR